MNRFPWAVALTLLLTIVSAPFAAAEPMDGTVSGKLTNGTAGGSSPSGAVVSLLAFDVQARAAAGQATTTADADGRYSFAGVDRSSNRAYIVLAQHENVNYSNGQPFQLVDQTAMTADITVYDTTTSDAAMRLERTNLMAVAIEPGMAQFFQMGTLVNTGDRTFVTENPQDGTLARGLKFNLPRGALSASMQSGFSDDDLIASVDGVQIIEPILPGPHAFALAFQLPYTGSSLDLTTRASYPIGTFGVYVPERGASIDASQLAAQGTTQMGQESFAVYQASDVAKETVLSVKLNDLPRPAGSGLGTQQLAIISLGVAIFVLAAGVLLLSLRRPTSAAPAPAPALPDHQGLEQERLALVMRLAALDERYAAGEISEESYRVEREEGKQRLRELTLILRGSPTPA